MGQIEEIIAQQIIVGLDLHGLALAGPARIIEEMIVRDQALVGGLSVTHPDEYPTPFFDGWIAPDPQLVRYFVHARNADAGALAVKCEAVIAALQRVADDAAGGQRRKPVRAKIMNHCRLAVFGPVKCQRLTEQSALKRLFRRDLVAPGADVPIVS